MLRSFPTIVIAGIAAGLATESVQAGGCTDPCGLVTVEAVSVPTSAPFYLVDQGPVYYGPGITRGPTYFEVLTPSHRFPYVGGSYYWAAPVEVRSYGGHRQARRLRVR
jgi:hypothetical protein